MLTDTAVRAIPIPTTDQLIPAGSRDGLYLRVRKSGRKTWVIRRRVDGEWRVRTLGDFPKVNARAARAAATTGDAPAKATTFKAAAKTFCDDEIMKRYRSAPEESVAYFTRDCAAWNSRRVDRIKRGDIVALVRKKAAERPNAALKLLALLKQFFRWAAIGEFIPFDPSVGVTAKALNLPVYQPRQRVLTDDEIRGAWAIPDEPYGRLIRFALLTACRIGEAQAFEPAHLVDGIWTIPISKNGEPHAVPLPPRAKSLAEAGWPRRQYRSLYSYLVGLEVGWNLHDLRRTAATRMRQAGVAIEIIEAVLNHAPPKLVRVYQRPDLTAEKLAALTALEKAVLAIVEPKKEEGAAEPD
ncbi:MAG: site-specific integrase [Lautropia sp.]